MNAKISLQACRDNCARAYITKRTIGKKGEGTQLKTHYLYACLQCKRYKRPSIKEMANVIVEKTNYVGRKKNGKERSMARASSLERTTTRLYNHFNKIPPLDNTQDRTIETDSGEHTEGTQSNDIYDVGIPVNVDEVFK
jgi:hypothetical protein